MHALWRQSRGRHSPSEPFLSERNPKRALALARRFGYFPANGEYLKDVPLPDYRCAQCNATWCKLWRQYQTFSPKLLCAICVAKDQKKDISDIDASGKRGSDLGIRTDQIGWYVPAVPTEDGAGYWGYCSVPRLGCDWWYKLPTLPEKLTAQFLPKDPSQPNTCINQSGEHKCKNPATIMAVVQAGGASVAFRCCTEEACKRQAAEIAILYINEFGIQ